MSSSRRPAVHFALTSHGLGHVTRALTVIRALHELEPDTPLIVSSTVDAAWLQAAAGFPVRYRRQAYEPGAVQKNCFEVDVAATLDAYRRFAAHRDSLLDAELRFLRDNRVGAVIADIPALPVAAAREAGLPAIGISNFTWDWILEPWCESADRVLVDGLRADYAGGTCQLCLPFGPAGSPFPAFEAAPLLARRAVTPAAEVRCLLELDTGPLAVVCPGGWRADDWPPIHARTGRFSLVTVNNLPVTSDAPLRKLGDSLPGGISMPDLIAAADVVLGKPGYGLASECLTHRVPFAMVERPNFRESGCLVPQLATMGRCASTTIETFFAGEWASVLEAASTGGSDWIELEPEPERTVAARVVGILA